VIISVNISDLDLGWIAAA